MPVEIPSKEEIRKWETVTKPQLEAAKRQLSSVPERQPVLPPSPPPSDIPERQPVIPPKPPSLSPSIIPERQPVTTYYDQDWQNKLSQLPSNYMDLPPKEQFRAATIVGLIPLGSQFAPQYDGKELTGWGYYTPEQVKSKREYTQQLLSVREFENELKASSPDLYEIYKKGGIAAYDKEVAKREKAFEDAKALLKNYKVPGTDDSYYISDFIKDSYGEDKNKQKLDKALSTLRTAGFSDQDIAVARVQGLSSPLGAIGSKPVEITKPGWFDRTALSLESWTNEFTQGGGKVKTGAIPTDILASTAEGAIAAGVMTLTAIPILTLKAAGKPAEAPKLAWETGKGLVTHVKDNVVKLLTGQYIPSLMAGNAFNMTYDTLLTALIVKGGVRGAKAVVTRLTTYVVPRGVPASLIAKEASTGRIKTPDAFAKEYADALNEVERLAMTKGGKFTGEVPIRGTPYSLRYLKTPLEQKIGNVVFHGSNKGLKFVEGGFEVGKTGLYSSPWAALGFTRGGTSPSLVMVITDVSKLKSGAKGLAKGLTESDKFIRGAEEGFYGPSKSWRGDLETETVGAPGTKIAVPPPKAGLLTRALAGGYSDFFTTDAGKFMPIKLAADVKRLPPETVAILNNPANLYAVKLYSLFNALRDTSEALKHPGLMLKDISGTFKELLKIENYFERGSKAGYVTMPGVRNVYLVTNIGQWLRDTANNLFGKAFKKTKSELGKKAKTDSTEFRRALERNMEIEYRANARALIDSFRAVARAYSASESARSKFEASYLASLGMSSEALARSAAITSSAISEVTRDMERVYPVSRLTTPSRVTRTIATPRTPRTPETPRTPKTPRTPRIPKTPKTPRTPRTPRIPAITTSLIPLPKVETGAKAEKRKYPIGTYAWRQGFGYRILEPPYDQDHFYFVRKPPEGVPIVKGARSAYRSIVTQKGSVPPQVAIDMGIMDIYVVTKGKKSQMRFKRDIKQKTKLGQPTDRTMVGVRV